MKCWTNRPWLYFSYGEDKNAKAAKAFLKQSKQLSNQWSKLIFMNCWRMRGNDQIGLRREVDRAINEFAAITQFSCSPSFDKPNAPYRLSYMTCFHSTVTFDLFAISGVYWLIDGVRSKNRRLIKALNSFESRQIRTKESGVEIINWFHPTNAKWK